MSNSPDEARPAWLEAVGMAARAHQGQVRKDGRTPYMAHVVRVTLIVRDLFNCGDQSALTAALLHDTIEDTGGDYDDIAGEFGAEVADLVAALTKNMAMPEEAREQDYDERLSRADWRARLIKLADVYDNLTDHASRIDSGGEPLEKPLSKAERALKLTERDVSVYPETARAVKLVRALVDDLSRAS